MLTLPIVISVALLIITAVSLTYSITSRSIYKQLTSLTIRIDNVEKQVVAINIDRSVINQKLDEIKITMKEMKDLLQLHLSK